MHVCIRRICYNIPVKTFSVQLNVSPFCSSRPQYRCISSKKKKFIDLDEFPPERIRNLSIIAHIDHGKSTLSDRLLETTGTIDRNAENKQVLDKLQVERERGITVKAQTASMIYQDKNGFQYLLNLIDTPGHIDFSYEVSRSLAACQGAVLLVDASQGAQAQTVSNFYLAFGEGLEIIPALNKVDLPSAEPDRVIQEMTSLFEVDSSQVLHLSAKSGLGVPKLLEDIVARIPAPNSSRDRPLSCLLFDTWYDNFVGVICMIAVRDGIIKEGDQIVSAATNQTYEVGEVGLMYPDRYPTRALFAGQVGYVTLSMKTARDAHIGDTFYHKNKPTELFPGFHKQQPMVFSGLYPVDTNDFRKLSDALDRLTLNDSSVTIARESSASLGQGFRLGFLGSLHMDVFRQRLEQEHQLNVINTSPTVSFKVKKRGHDSETIIQNPDDFPSEDERATIETFQEPMVIGTIISPERYLGTLMELCIEHRGEQLSCVYLGESRIMLKYKLPMTEILTEFYEQLKSRTSGFASFDYTEAGYEESDLVKVGIMLNRKYVDSLSCIVHRSKSERVARDWAARLKDIIRRQQFEVVIQAVVGSKVVARETVKAFRKDVTAKCYGGDRTRRMKLLNRQKEGKKRLKEVSGGVELPHEAFVSLISTKVG